MAANAVAALEHEDRFGVELAKVELGAIETNCPEVVAYLPEVGEVHRGGVRVEGKQTRHVFELDRHVFVDECDETLDSGDAHERHVSCAKYVEIALAAAREELVHADHEIDACAPRRLFAVLVEHAETASEDDARDILHAAVGTRVEGGEVEAVVFEVREAALDYSGDNVLFRFLEDDVAYAIANVDAAAHVEDVLCIKDELLPRAYFEERMLCT